MASYGQKIPHTLQLMHISGSMTYICFLIPEMALVGHLMSQIEQPTHSDVM
jgi:hypothetical protein